MTKIKEIWKDIPNYEGYYMASSLGRVKSLRNNCIMKGSSIGRGYIMNRLSVNGKFQDILAHRIIALTFIPNPENKSTVNHKNGIKIDNRVENLEWATMLENVRHADSTGLRRSKHGANSVTAKLTWDNVNNIRVLAGTMPMLRMAKIFNVDFTTIKEIIIHENWKDPNYQYIKNSEYYSSAYYK